MSSDAAPPEGGPPPAPPLGAKPAPSTSRARRLRLQRGLSAAAPWLVWTGAAAAALLIAGEVHQPHAVIGEALPQRVTLAAPEDAMISSVRVEPGQVVRAGEVVLAFDTGVLERELGAELGELERLTLDVPAQRELLAGEILARDHELQRDAERAAVDLQQLLAEEQRDKAELAQVDAQIARHRERVQRGLTSSEALEELELHRAALAQAVAEYTGLQKAARAHADAARARLGEHRRVARAPQPVGGPDVDPRLEPLRALVRAQEERVAYLQERIRRLQVVAPHDAVVASIDRRPGDFVPLGEPVVTLLPRRAERVVAWLDETRAHSVHLGDPAVVRSRSGRSARGRVIGLGPGVVEQPLRFQRPQTPLVYGRPIFIAVTDAADILPDEVVDVSFAEGSFVDDGGQGS